jgi:hypothetical protein
LLIKKFLILDLFLCSRNKGVRSMLVNKFNMILTLQ